MALEMAVRAVQIDATGGPCSVLLVGLYPSGDAVYLPIAIGRPEATAIALAQVKVPRPQSHDLMVDVLRQLRGSLERVVVERVINGVFHARLELATVQGPRSLDSRPSDAIALAVRLNVPVHVEEAVVEVAGVKRSADSMAAGGQKQAEPEPADAEPVDPAALGPFREVIASLNLETLDSIRNETREQPGE